MDPYQRAHLCRNLATLIGNTVCTHSLLQRLKSKCILGDSDISLIETRKYEGSYSQSSLLFSVLQTRYGGYEALITALHSTQQLKSSKILLHDDYKKESRDLLKICVQTGDYDQVVTFLQPQLGKDLLSNLVGVLITHDKLLHLCVSNSQNDHPTTIESKKKIIHALVQVISNDEDLKLADILEEKDFNGRTPLLQENASIDLLKCLLSYGALVSCKDQQGNNILHFTAEQPGIIVDEYHKLVKDATERDASVVNHQNSHGETVLHVALKYLDLLEKTVNIFEQQKFDFNLTDNQGNGLLHVLAAEKSRSRSLMKRIAMASYQSWNISNKTGKTPMQISIEAKNYKMLSIIAEMYAETCGGNYDKAINICKVELEKLSSIRSLEATWLLMTKARIYLKYPKRSDLWSTSMDIFQTCYKIRQEILGQNHPDTFQVLAAKAYALEKLGNFNEALENFTSVKKRQNQHFDEENMDTLESKRGLAIALGQLGQIDEAAELLQEMLQAKCQLFGENHLETLVTQNDIANLVMHSGKCNQDVLQALQNILTKRKNLLGEKHDCIFHTQLDILNCHRILGQWTEAVIMVEEMEKTNGKQLVAQYVTNSQLKIMLARSYCQGIFESFLS